MEEKRKIGLLGAGKLGLTFALLCDKAGYDVHCFEVDKERVQQIQDKTLKTTEPQVEELLKTHTLKFHTKSGEILNSCNLIFVFVATPSLPDGSYDHSQVERAVEDLKSYNIPNKTIIVNCTVMPKFCGSLQEKVNYLNYNVLYNPEFIAQGNVVNGLEYADTVLIGGNPPEELLDVYKKIMKTTPNFKILTTTGAEIAKIGINTYLTLKTAYANLLGRIAIQSGEEATVTQILEAIGSDSRIGNKYLGYGFPALGICVLPSQDIITKRGVIQIKDIQIGDYVLTHTGKWNKVTEIFTRPYKGKLCKFKLEGHSTDYLITTPEHPIWAAKKIGSRYYTTGGKKKLLSMIDSQYEKLTPSFIEANDLQHADFLCIPKLNTEIQEKKYIEFDNSLAGNFPSKMELTPNLMRLFGYYLAEGSTYDNRRVCFSFHEKEGDFHKDVISLLQDNFKLKCYLTKADTKAVHIRGTSPKLGTFMNFILGKGAVNKKVPYEWLELSDEYLIELLRGMWYGDGSNSYKTFTYATISKELFNFIKLMLYRLGICFNTRIAKERIGKDGVKHKQAYFIKVSKKAGVEAFNKIIPLKAIDPNSCHGTGFKRGDKRTTLWQDNVLYYHVRERQNIDYEGEVWNIEVENDNSYMLTNSVVHNCLPRDVRALKYYINNEVSANDELMNTLHNENLRQASFLLRYYTKKNPNKDVPFIFSYITYKKGIDFMAESAQMNLCLELLKSGYTVVIENLTGITLPPEFLQYSEKILTLPVENGYRVN